MTDEQPILRFKSIVKRWNKAEGALKYGEGRLASAQQPAMNELRYAGRRVIDALAIFLHSHDEDISAHHYKDIGGLSPSVRWHEMLVTTRAEPDKNI